VALELARLGADVTLMGRTRSHLDRQAEILSGRFGVRSLALLCDVADEGQVTRAFDAAREALGAPHVLVNNAGQAEGAPFMETSREVWDRMLAINLTAQYLCIRQVLPAMIAARAGRIVNVASTAGLKGYSRAAAYCASKHGLVGLTRALAAETAKLGITVNAVCPGYTATEMTVRTVDSLARGRGISAPEAQKMIERANPLGRLVEPREVADAVGWLCGPGASAITGQAIAVAGGEVT
jgi:3-hydroxybutyrate dehydrogenase